MKGSSRSIASGIGCSTRSRRRCSTRSSCGSARSRARRLAWGGAVRPRGIASCAGSAGAIASSCATSSFDVVADSNQPIARAVKAANNDTILMAFNIEAFGKDEAAVIDVTRLFTTEVPEFSVRSTCAVTTVRRQPLVRRARGVVP